MNGETVKWFWQHYSVVREIKIVKIQIYFCSERNTADNLSHRYLKAEAHPNGNLDFQSSIAVQR